MIHTELQQPPIACGVGVTICTRNLQKRGTHHQHWHVATASCRRGKSKSLRLPGLQTHAVCKRKSQRALYNIWEGCSLLISLPKVCPLQQHSESVQNNSSVRIHTRLQWQVQPQRTQVSLHLCSTNRSAVRAPNVNSLPLGNVFKAVTVVLMLCKRRQK